MSLPESWGLDQVSRGTKGSQILCGTLATAEAALPTQGIGCDLESTQHVYAC